MPIYEYECARCGQVTEIFQRMSDEPLKKCQCGGSVKKLMSLNSFHLKGTGWYVTDYGKGNKGQGTEPIPGDKTADKPEKAETPAKTEKPKTEKPKTETKAPKTD